MREGENEGRECVGVERERGISGCSVDHKGFGGGPGLRGGCRYLVPDTATKPYDITETGGKGVP